MTSRRVAALAWTLAAASVTAAPQQSRATAIVAGVVIDATTGHAVGRAAVRAIGPNVKQTRLTDDRGRFYFAALPPGEVTITAHKAGYIDGAYGKARAAGEGSPLTIEKSSTSLPFFRIDLFRAAIISGQVIDETGDPLTGVGVRAIRREFVDGVWNLFETYRDVTDDHGDFRLFDLVPGEYLVMVPTTQVTMPVEFLEEIGAGGRVRPEVAKAVPIQMISTIEIVGESARLVADTPTVPPPVDGRTAAYRTQYYPGGNRVRQAMPIILGSGEQRHGVQFQMVPFPTARVSGRVFGPAGPVGNHVLRLTQIDDDDAELGNDVAVAISAANGTFTFFDVPAGQYAVEARGVLHDSIVPVLVERPGEARHTWARATLTVGDDEIDNVEITVGEAPVVSGQIVLDSGRSKAGTAAFPVATVSLVWANGVRPPYLAEVRDDGSFRADGLVPGTYLVRTARKPGWYQKTVTVNGERTEDVIVVSDAGKPFVVVAVTDRPSQLTGVVRNDRLNTVAGATVLAQPVSRGPSSIADPARARLVQSNGFGVYTFFGLPPGEYSVIALDALSVDGWQEPRRLHDLRAAGARIAVKDAQTQALDLRLTMRR